MRRFFRQSRGRRCVGDLGDGGWARDRGGWDGLRLTRAGIAFLFSSSLQLRGFCWCQKGVEVGVDRLHPGQHDRHTANKQRRAGEQKKKSEARSELTKTARSPAASALSLRALFPLRVAATDMNSCRCHSRPCPPAPSCSASMRIDSLSSRPNGSPVTWMAGRGSLRPDSSCFSAHDVSSRL